MTSVSFKERWGAHKSCLERNKHGNPRLQRIYNKYGDIFSYEILEYLDFHEEQPYLDREKFWANELEKNGKSLLNVGTIGHKSPNYGRIPSEETRRKISIAGKGRIFSKEHKKKLSLALKGRVFSKEHLKNLATNRKYYFKEKNSFYGKKHTKAAKKKMSEARLKNAQVFGVFKNEKLIGEYKNKTLCAKELNLHRYCIFCCLKGSQKTSGGYTFKFISDAK